MGLVLNRPSEAPIDEAVPDLAWVAGSGRPRLPRRPGRAERRDRAGRVGGPLPGGRARRGRPRLRPRRRRGPGGARRRGPPRPRLRRARRLGSRASSRPSSPRRPGSSRRRCREELFSDDPDGLWAAVLRRKGREFALLSTMPPDPVAELSGFSPQRAGWSIRPAASIRLSGGRSRDAMLRRLAVLCLAPLAAGARCPPPRGPARTCRGRDRRPARRRADARRAARRRRRARARPAARRRRGGQHRRRPRRGARRAARRSRRRMGRAQPAAPARRRAARRPPVGAAQHGPVRVVAARRRPTPTSTPPRRGRSAAAPA